MAEGIRARRRRDIEERAVHIGRRMLGEVGPGALSMRAIARELGMASSAIHRYYPTRDHLLTALLLTVYEELATALEAAQPPPPPPTASPGDCRAAVRGQLSTLLRTLRDWAVEHPHDWGLLYGTPVSGYAAPSDTVTAAGRVYLQFLSVARAAFDAGGQPPAGITARDERLRGIHPEEPAVAALALVWASTAVGAVSLEVFGHLRKTVSGEEWITTTTAACLDLAGLPLDKD